ncbi:hypothetical protein HYT05_03785 [Candidatus Kaiserbacteria bacterium]|nr:hypothetical protein [Candidatus Kaiserbacteria bacterium]
MRIVLMGAVSSLVGIMLSTQAHAYPDRSFALGPSDISIFSQPGERTPRVNIDFVPPRQWADIKQSVLREITRIVHDPELAKDPIEAKRQAEKAFDDFFRGFATLLGYDGDTVISSAIAMTALHQLMIEYMDDVDIHVARTIQNLWKFISKNAMEDSIRWEKRETLEREKAGKW